MDKYINRDLSWIEFNLRVLQEAEDPSNPMLERTKFLSISASNLDEFMSVRVAGIKDMIKASVTKKDFSGYTPQELHKRIMKRLNHMVRDQYLCYRELLRQLAKKHIHFNNYSQLNLQQQKAMNEYFHDIVFPVLTPMAIDSSRPFPLVHTLGVYLAVMLHKDGDSNESYFAIIQLPSILPRHIPLPFRKNSKKKEFILLEHVISEHIQALFSGYHTVEVSGFRITRNGDITLNEEGAEDLLEEIEKNIKKRRRGIPIRLEVEKNIHPDALEFLKLEFEIIDEISVIDGPLDLSFLMKFSNSLVKNTELKYPRFVPVYPKALNETNDIFSILCKEDVLLHHPYESFDAVNDFIEQAANDPDVLAIKMTLYRVSGNSILVEALARAAEAGKQVTVAVELKARFDEERNIAWAKKLEQSGCHVVYGLVGLKTHAKIILVVRQEKDYLRRYVHVSTGNYNDTTASLYTDIGLFTSHPLIGEDASALFNEITGYSSDHQWLTFGVAPNDLQQKLFDLIQRESLHAKEGKKARIIAKINSLSNKEMVDKLYEASQAGVQIDLIVRGVCCLCPGIPGLSENIRVISIVDRFLEHSRIFYFENNGNAEVWLSSADWMTRNLTRRIELMCPVYDIRLRKKVVRILHLVLSDNVKARKLLSTGKYENVRDEKPSIRSQFELFNTAYLEIE